MAVKLDMSGFDNVMQNLEKLSGKYEVSLIELFSDDFISKHTGFASFQALIDASGVEAPNELYG